jgi:hypothetical protein
MPGRAILTAEPSNGVIKLAIAAIRRTIRLVAGDSAPAGSGTLRVRIEERDSLEKKMIEKSFYHSPVWAGLMKRIHFVGAIRPHTPMCDATPPPEKIPRG